MPATSQDAAARRRSTSRRFAELRYPRRAGQALSGVNLKVARGEFVSFIGPSGCGKTTLLRAIADLETPTSGAIRVNGMSPHEARAKRAYGYVFQAPALYPWRTVARNIALPLEIMGFDKAEREARVEAAGSNSSISRGFGNKFPWQLSGGMQQRASIARALSFDPDLLLMDEPFGALDEIVRDMLNQQLLRLWDVTGKTVLVRHPFDPRGGVPLDPHRRDVAAPGAHLRRHRMRLPARPHAGNPRDAGIPRSRQPRAPRPAGRDIPMTSDVPSPRPSPAAGRGGDSLLPPAGEGGAKRRDEGKRRMKSVLPIATVLLALLAVWYVAAALMNAPLQRDLFANAGRTGLFDSAISSPPRSTWSGRSLPAPHQIVGELYKLVFATPPTSKRSLVYHGAITLEETLIGFCVGAALGIGLAVAHRRRCAGSNGR